MNTITRHGYTAKIEFNEQDNIFAGQILGIRSIISFHGETVAALRREGKSAVDDYLKECKELGVSPEKPASGRMWHLCT